MAGNEEGQVCELNAAIRKLPNSLIDVCLIYGIDEKTSGDLSQLDSPGEDLLEKLHKLEVEPYSLAVINATLTHFPHLSSGGLDDSYVSIDTTVDEKELGVSWDVVRTLQKFFFPERALIEVTDKQPPSSTMSLVLTDVVGVRTYCTGLCFYRPFSVVQNGNQYKLEPCSRNSCDKLVYVPTCAVFISVSPCYNIQKELLSCLLYKLAQEDDLKFWDVVKKFVQKLFLIPVPPPGRICIEFSLDNYSGCINPPLSEFVNLDIRLNYPFLSLSVDHVLEVTAAFLLEQRILFTSTSYTLLTYNIECFLHYISPFEWRSTYVPVLPSDKMGLLDAPGVFLYGCNSANVTDEVLDSVEDLVVVDLDKDEVRQERFQEVLPKMPKEACEDFKKSYKQLRLWYELEEADNPIRYPAVMSVQHRREFERRLDIQLLDLFLNLMVDLYGGITHYLCSGNLRYEECPFYKLAEKETQEFYKLALATDLFSLLLQSRKDSTTRDSFTRLSEKKRRDKRVIEHCEKELPRQKSDDVTTAAKSQSLHVNRSQSYHPSNSPAGSSETFSFASRKKSSSSVKLPPDSSRQSVFHSCPESDIMMDVCGCDPDSYCKVMLPSLCGEVVAVKFYESLIDTVSDIIKESTTTTDKMAPALYLRACIFIAIGKLDQGFNDFATLDKHSVQLMPSQRMLEGILDSLSKEVAKIIKSRPYWPIFTRPKVLRQGSRVVDITTKLPNKPLRNEEFLKTVQKNNLVVDPDSAGRLYYLLVENKPAVLPTDFEVFYGSYKNLVEDNMNTDLANESLKTSILHFKHPEKILATLTSSQLKTSCGSGHVILTTCRLLVRSCLKVFTMCNLTKNVKVEKQDNVNVLGQGQPHLVFVMQKDDILDSVSLQHTTSRTTLKGRKNKPSQPYVIFNDKKTREIWLKMIWEMQLGLLLARTKKDLQFIKQAESNIIILGTILNSTLRCKTVVQRNPFRILHLSTKGTSTSEFKVAVEESLMCRINPSLNQVTKATIECSLYVPPDPDSQSGDGGTGKLWLGLGTGLLRVYDSVQYFLESDTKITDSSQRTGTRLSSFLLVDNYVWAGSLLRTIYILDSDTSTVVSKLSNLEDDPSVLALGKLDHQKVVWSLLIKGIVIAWNPSTRERMMTIQLSASNVPKNLSMICFTMAVQEDHLWIGTNLDKMVVLKIEGSNRWSVAQEVCVKSSKNENQNQIKCVTISNCGLVWCSTKGPTHLTVFDAKTFQKKCTYSKLKDNRPVNVILPVKNQVWCGTKDGNILIFDENEKDFEEKFEPLKTIKAHEDTIRTMLLAENGHVVSGSGSKDGSAAIWNPDLVKDINKT